jgi:bis(5'-nucleosyl)-tetraphosphatase (symmetrical)
MPRRIFIGDIRAAARAFEALLAKLRFDPAASALGGDLVNRRPDSLGALRLAKRLGMTGVLGNHDVHLLRRGGLRAKKAGDTLDDVLAAEDHEELLAWLGAWPLVRCSTTYARPRRPAPALARPEHSSRTSTRCGRRAPRSSRCVRAAAIRGNLPSATTSIPSALPPVAPLPPREHGGRTAVFGHWAAQGLLVRARLRGLDSGCVWGKALTAWIAGEDRIVSVNARRAYARIAAE